jgi:hypothetical protein
MLGNDGELLGPVIERPLDLGAAFDDAVICVV